MSVPLELVQKKLEEMQQAARGDSQGATVTEFLIDCLNCLDGENDVGCPAEWVAGCADEVAEWAEEAALRLRALKSPVSPHMQQAIEWCAQASQWDDHPEYRVADWRGEVLNHDTERSYREWVICQAEARDDDTEAQEGDVTPSGSTDTD
jgi:hypothetical protein